MFTQRTPSARCRHVCACFVGKVSSGQRPPLALKLIKWDQSGRQKAIPIYLHVIVKIRICLLFRASDQLLPAQQFHHQAGGLRRHVLLGLSHASRVWQQRELRGALALGAQSECGQFWSSSGSWAWDWVHYMNCSFTCLTSVFCPDVSYNPNI